MNNDLAERLRAAADKSADGGGEWYQLIHRCREAADEIDAMARYIAQLQSVLRESPTWKDRPFAVAVELSAAHAEIERLHRALGEQTESARKWKNRAHSRRRKIRQIMGRVPLPTEETA